MREVAFLAGQKRPQLSRLRSHVNDLLRLAVASEKPALISQLSASLTALTGNVTQTAANVVLNQMLSLAGHAGRSLRKNPPASHAQQRVSNLSRVEQLIEAMQGRPHELAPVQKVSNLSRVEEYLEAMQAASKKKVSPTPEVQHRPPNQPMLPPNTNVLPSGKIQIKSGLFNRVYDADDPMLTREMIPVKSSNVHSIGFEFNHKQPANGVLLVRFLGGESNNRHGGGPLYEYFKVHPDEFTAFRKAANSGGKDGKTGGAGIWVWDELRVRGSRVMHQKRYSLRRIQNGYLPRQATVRNGREMWVRRTRTTAGSPGRPARTLVSPLPDRDLGPARGRPNRGAPRRG